MFIQDNGSGVLGETHPAWVYPSHQQKLKEVIQRGIDLTEEEGLMKSDQPYLLAEGKDFDVMTATDSQTVWKDRTNKKVAPNSSFNSERQSLVVSPRPPFLLPSPCPAPLPTPSVAQTAPALPLQSSLMTRPVESTKSSNHSTQVFSSPNTLNVLDEIMADYDSLGTMVISPQPPSEDPLPPTEKVTQKVSVGTVTEPLCNPIVEAIDRMGANLVEAIYKQTQQFDILRATVTTLLRRQEDREMRGRPSVAEPPAPKKFRH